MKILFINSKSFDYLQDLTYSGLIKYLGPNNIIDYKTNFKYHLPIKKYPKNLGFTRFSIPLHLSIDFGSFDAVILGSAKQDALEILSKILPKISNVPLIFIDGGDREEIGGDFERLGAKKEYLNFINKRPFDIILKREYIPDLHDQIHQAYPLPFSFPHNITINKKVENEKKYQVSFWAQQKPAIREKALQLLKGQFDCDQNGTSLGQNFKKYKRKGSFYLEELSKCKVAINLRGGGWDTMRYWELPAAGTLMISQQPKILIPNNFENGKHVIFCNDSLDDLLDKINFYLNNIALREEITNQAKLHLLKYHLNSCRAEYIVNIIKKKITKG